MDGVLYEGKHFAHALSQKLSPDDWLLVTMKKSVNEHQTFSGYVLARVEDTENNLEQTRELLFCDL